MSSYSQALVSPHVTGRGRFIQVTHDQLAILKARRGEAPDGGHITDLELRVLLGLMRFSWNGQNPCRATNLQIAVAAGIPGGEANRRTQVRIALYGRTYRKGRWDPESGKWKRDGERVTVHGLCHPSRGFVEMRPAEPDAPRELVLTPRWLGRPTDGVYRDGGRRRAGPKTPPAPGTTGPPDDNPPAPPHAAVVTASDNAPTPPDSDDAPPAVGPAAAEPSAEVLNRVLGGHTPRVRHAQAARLLVVLERRGARFERLNNGTFSLIANPGMIPPDEDEKALLKWLKPEILAILEAEAKAKSPKSRGGPPDRGYAPRVVCHADARTRIKRLATGGATDAECRALARTIVSDPGFRHNDVDPTRSEETLHGLAVDTRDGVLPPDVLRDAFEEACKPKKRNRGASLVDAVKRMKATPRRPDGRASPP